MEYFSQGYYPTHALANILTRGPWQADGGPPWSYLNGHFGPDNGRSREVILVAIMYCPNYGRSSYDRPRFRFIYRLGNTPVKARGVHGLGQTNQRSSEARTLNASYITGVRQMVGILTETNWNPWKNMPQTWLTARDSTSNSCGICCRAP